METRIKKWGNSLALRIPNAYAQQLGLRSDSSVNIVIEGDRLVIEPVAPDTLEELLAQITPDNLHSEIDWGGPVGKESW